MALWVLANKVYYQVIDVPANACATIALFLNKQVSINADPPPSK